MKKTNAMRILDGAKVAYRAVEYADDGEHELGRGAAKELAAKLGIRSESCFKTIVMRSEDKEVLVFCQRADREVNLKKARIAAGVKELSPVKPDELLALTIGMKRSYRTFIDSSVLSQGEVYVSAGMRGKQLALAPQDLLRVTGASVTDLLL